MEWALKKELWEAKKCLVYLVVLFAVSCVAWQDVCHLISTIFCALASSTSLSTQGSLSCYEASKIWKSSEKLVKFAYVY